MLYMVLERFRPGCGPAVYERLRERGRMMPDGVEYVDSWVEPDASRCFQLMTAEDPQLLRTWAANWEDLVDFEFIPVVHGRDMADRFR